MALNRKYAALPDLDSAPDIYETPELTDDNSTLPTGTVRSHSPSSAYNDFDDDEDAPGISRARLHPDEARSHFEPAQIDARDVDFSDRVTGKRKSYKASTRRSRRAQDGTEELGDFSDEEDGESLERKMARLRREIEEVREEKVRRENERKHAGEEGKEPDLEEEVDGLSRMLEGISAVQGTTNTTAASRLAKNLGASLNAKDMPVAQEAAAADGSKTATYTVTYAPSYDQSHTLAKAADFDSRLVLLEKALGITSSTLPTLDAHGSPQAVLPTLDILQRQISLLTSTSSSTLDNVGRRIRTLTQEAERLKEARNQAKVAQDALRAAGGDSSVSGDAKDAEEAEQMAKINALYGTLPTIENLAPLLPPLLDRLRSLRAIHADAATASESLERAEKRQEEMAADIKKWREGLEKVEESMKTSETTTSGNMKVVENWVKELEERMQKLGA